MISAPGLPVGMSGAEAPGLRAAPAQSQPHRSPMHRHSLALPSTRWRAPGIVGWKRDRLCGTVLTTPQNRWGALGGHGMPCPPRCATRSVS